MSTTRFRLGIAVVALSAIALTARAAPIVPSIEITGINGVGSGVNSCGGSNLNVSILLNNPGVEYDNYEIYNGSTLLYRWSGEHYGGVGPDTYGLQSDLFAPLPADSTLTAIIYTFAASSLPALPYTPDKFSYASQIRWNCTTGALIDITNTIGATGTVAAVATPVPVGAPATLGALLATLAGLGAWTLRRRRRVRG